MNGENKKAQPWWSFFNTNCLIVTPIDDAYLDDGTYLGLTVGKSILA